MSKETIIEERMVRVETKLDNLSEDTKDIKQVLKDLNIKFERLDEKYSAKWVEKAFYGLSAAIGIYIIYLILDVVTK